MTTNRGQVFTQGQQVPVGSILAPGVIAGPGEFVDTYPVSIDQYHQGGLRSVDTIQQRNTIPVEHRVQGMWCFVTDDNTYYSLNQDLLGWTPQISSVSGVQTLINVSFDSETLVEIDNVTRVPIVQVYFDEGVFEESPFLYGDESTAIYNGAGYGQEITPVIRMGHYELVTPVIDILYFPVTSRISVRFDAPRTGFITGLF